MNTRRFINVLMVIVQMAFFNFTCQADVQGSIQKSDSVPNGAINDGNEYYGEYLRYTDHVYIPSVASVQFNHLDFALSSPLIRLGTEEQLRLSFDELDSDSKEYSYTIVHCGADWKPSDLFQEDYIDGFIEDQIFDYQFSVNTIQQYTHYNLSFPNDNMKPKISGNYLLKVYFEEPDSLVITRRFMVVKNEVEITPSFKEATLLDDRKYKQEIDFVINHSGVQINDPFTELKVVLSQNHRWDNEIRDLKPLFIKGDELVYDFDEDNVFAGGNEYRFFDTRDLKYYSTRIAKITRDSLGNHIYLKHDLPRMYKTYNYYSDINGRFHIAVNLKRDEETEGDYAWIHFSVPMVSPISGGNFYLFGQLTDWAYDKKFRLQYNFKTRAYEIQAYLKQGYYNYEYVFLQNNEKVADNTLIEGSHFETENDYIIYVYHRSMAGNFDRLIGVKHINSSLGTR